MFILPILGNAGTSLEPKLENVAINVEDIASLVAFAQKSNIETTIVGPEVPLALGGVDAFNEAGLPIFGPTQGAAQLESSKAFTKDFLVRHNIPTAAYSNFTDIAPAKAYVTEMTATTGFPIVIKADGLAAVKGLSSQKTNFKPMQLSMTCSLEINLVKRDLASLSKSF
jgi:phosphoribosylamine--glycine ligase